MNARPMQDNRHHAAVATGQRNRRVPIERARKPVETLGSPYAVEFDARPVQGGRVVIWALVIGLTFAALMVGALT